jgi:hypothetical protein
MNATNTREIYVYDHPESKIRFLETTLRGQDWRLRIAYPANDPKASDNIAAVRAACQRKGYVLNDTTDTNGSRILELHHLGEGGHPGQLLNELGLAKGTAHLITHPSITIDALAEGAQNLGKKMWHVARDPARANGIIYLAAEGFLVTSGKTLLQSIAYTFFLLQSLTYLTVAKNNNDSSFDQYKKKLDSTLRQGGSAESLHFEPTKDKESSGFVRNTINVIRRYPIQIGAAFNDIGMGIYMLRSLRKKWGFEAFEKGDLVLAKKMLGNVNIHDTQELAREAKTYISKTKYFNGFRSDIAGAAVSMVAWAFLLITPKSHSENEKEEAEGRPLLHTWQKFRENPQVGAGLLTFASSGLRLKTALAARDRRQSIGEGIYLGGDFELLFTKNDNYGSKNSKDVKVLAERIGDYLYDLPGVYGHASQEKVVQSMANFLRAKTLQEIKDNPHAVKYTLEELNQRREVLVREVKLRIRNQQDERLERVADAANRVVLWAPEAERETLLTRVAQGLSQLPWVHVTPQEMREAIVASQTRQPEITPPQNDRELREAIADLTNIVPHIDKGGTVAALYEALGSHLNHVSPARESVPTSSSVGPAEAGEMLKASSQDSAATQPKPTTQVHRVEHQAPLLATPTMAIPAHS